MAARALGIHEFVASMWSSGTTFLDSAAVATAVAAALVEDKSIVEHTACENTWKMPMEACSSVWEHSSTFRQGVRVCHNSSWAYSIGSPSP